jgi:hypothetical protein
MPSFKEILATAAVVVVVLIAVQSTVGIQKLDLSKLGK